MEVGKLKNIILLILLAVNAVLLGSLIADRVQTRRSENRGIAEVASVYEARGITLDSDISLEDTDLRVCAAERDLQKELAFASALLDHPAVEDLGGNIYAYTASNGEGRFRGTGEFEVFLTASRYTSAGDALALARQLGLNCPGDSAVVEWDGETAYVTLCCDYDGLPVYNCQVTFTYTVGRLTAVVGRRIPDTITGGEDTAPLGTLTVLLQFVRIADESGYVCREVTAMELGWTENVSVSGVVTLVPTWRIATDSGSYYINGITGEPVTGS